MHYNAGAHVATQNRLDALAGHTPMPEAYAHAHYIWFVFVGIALFSAVSLIIYGRVTARLDRGAAA